MAADEPKSEGEDMGAAMGTLAGLLLRMQCEIRDLRAEIERMKALLAAHAIADPRKDD